MRPLRIAILDIVELPTRALWARVMNANFASIMPQVLGVWCERAGHRVSYACYTGFGDPVAEVPPDVDLLFIGAFTQAARPEATWCTCCRTPPTKSCGVCFILR